jgi:hypothetical protein
MIVFIILSASRRLADPRPAGQTSEHVLDGRRTGSRRPNVNQPGLRLGDRLAARGPLLDASQASQVGRAYLECVIMNKITDDPVEGPGGLYWCTYVLQLADGDLTIGGLDPHGSGVYTFAVLGGTGAYAGASGEATLTDTDEGTEFVIDLG